MKSEEGRLAELVARQEQIREQARFRASREGRAERERSRSRYRNLSARGAVQAFQTEYKGLAQMEPFRPLRFADDAEEVRFFSDFVARVERKRGEPGQLAIADGLPLRAQDKLGRKAPVDLALERDGSTYRPKNAVVDVRLPARLSEGIVVGKEAVRFVPEAPAADGAVPLETNGKLFFADVAPDTDFFAMPVALGVETFLQLRSPESPEAHRIQVELPEGAELEPFERGARVTRAGETLLLVHPPLASDSQGKEVPVKLGVEGDTIRLEVRHRQEDLAYPLLVDPEITDDWRSGQDPTDPAGEWGEWSAGRPYGFPKWGSFGSGRYLEAAPGWYNAWEDGAYVINSPGEESFFVSAEVFGTRFGGAGQANVLELFIWSAPNNAATARRDIWGNIEWWRTDNQFLLKPNYSNTCCPDYRLGRSFWFKIHMANSSHRSYWTQGFFHGLVAVLSDHNWPYLTRTTPGPETKRWVDDETTTMTASARDIGLGVKWLDVYGPGFQTVKAHPCNGHQRSRCPRDWNDQVFSWRTGSWPEGRQQLGIHTTDIIGRQAPQQYWYVNVDHTEPAATPFGALFTDRDKPLYKSKYPLKIDANDSFSGVKSVEVKVDGERTFYEERPCTSSGCERSMTSNWDFLPDDYSHGEHTVTMHVRDPIAHESSDPAVKARHTKTEEWTVKVDHRAGDLRPYKFVDESLTDRMRARTNVSNGNLLVEASDLKIAGTGMDLSLSRFYNSRLAQTKGPLGYGWSLSAGQDVRLKQEPGTDNVQMFGPSGFVVRFKKPQDSNSFDTPPGIDGDLRKLDDGSFELKLDKSAEKLFFTPLGGASGGLMSSQKDRNGEVIDYTYTDGRLTSVKDTQDRTVRLDYEGELLKKVTDSAGRSWNFGYDTAKQELTSYTDPEGQTTRYEYGDKHRLARIIDPRATTEVGYDGELRRVKTLTRAKGKGAPEERTTTYSYTSGDRECPEGDDPAQDITDVTDARSNRTRYCRDDGKDHVRRVIDAKDFKRNTKYSPNGNVETYQGGGGAESSATYSGRDLSKVTGPTGAGSEFSYSNGSFPHFMTGSKDAQGNSLGMKYNSSGNLSETSASSSSQASVTLVSLDYNEQDEAACEEHTSDTGPKGTLRCSEDGNGNETAYDYDSKGNLLKKDPAGSRGTVRYTYDDLSRIDTVTDAKGQKADYDHDALDRIKTVTWFRADGSQAAQTSYGYDAAGNRTSRTDAQGTSTYSFDARNQLTKEQLPGGVTNDYAYDGVGNLLSFTDGGGQTRYFYDSVNLLDYMIEPELSSGEPESARTTHFEYNSDNRRKEIRYPNGLVTEINYEESSKALSKDPPDTDAGDTAQVEGIEVIKNSEKLVNLAWSYKDGDQPRDIRQSMDDERRKERTRYTYDHLNRLTKARTTDCGSDGVCADDPNSEPEVDNFTFEFDKNSNRLESTNTDSTPLKSYGYGVQNELCWVHAGDAATTSCSDPPSGAKTFSYDDNMNLTGSSEGLALGYNTKDQTVAIDPEGSEPEVSFGYLGDTQRERIRRGSTAQANSLLGLSADGSGESAVRFGRDSGGQLISRRSSGGRHFFHADSLGSVVAVTDQAGDVKARYRYDPFGNAVSADSFESGLSNRFRLAGQYLDPGTGLYKMGMRYMNPAYGNWTQKDPLDQVTEPRQSNRYGYAGQDPINLTDPSGLWWGSDWLSENKDAIITGLHATYIAVDAAATGVACGTAMSTLTPLGGAAACGGVVTAGYAANEYLESSGIWEGSYLLDE